MLECLLALHSAIKGLVEKIEAVINESPKSVNRYNVICYGEKTPSRTVIAYVCSIVKLVFSYTFSKSLEKSFKIGFELCK